MWILERLRWLWRLIMGDPASAANARELEEDDEEDEEDEDDEEAPAGF